MNLCVVSRPRHAGVFRTKASSRFRLDDDHPWLSIAPLSRPPIRSTRERLLYVGDAGRVVEPFTGEGIFYALKTGALAAKAILWSAGCGGRVDTWYAQRLDQVYRKRLWINGLARQSVLHPRLASGALEALRFWPEPLRHLTGKVVGSNG